MKVNQAFPRKYAEASDLGGKVVTLEIRNIGSERYYNQAQQEHQTMFIIFFKGATKGVIMSTRLAHEISDALGDDEMDNWPGKKVTLFAKTVRAFGKGHLVFGAKRAENGSTEPPAGLVEDEEP